MEKKLYECLMCGTKGLTEDKMISDNIYIYPCCKLCSTINKELYSIQPERLNEKTPEKEMR